MESLIARERRNFHKRLFETGTLVVNPDGIASNADKGNRNSRDFSRRIIEMLVADGDCSVQRVEKNAGQTQGTLFEISVAEFVRATFPEFQNIRPGKWSVLHLGNSSRIKTSSFSQYEHLSDLATLASQNPLLASVLGTDYFVSPDIVVYRDLYEDEEINEDQYLVGLDVCRYAELRKSNGCKPALHASISAKFTMRSDRAQNSRTEALNLIRNRKGRLPHIVVVTAEPTPGRLASLALGTGDIDCVYHFALNELQVAVDELGSDDSKEMLDNLVKGKRLKDISDLPLDLSV